MTQDQTALNNRAGLAQPEALATRSALPSDSSVDATPGPYRFELASRCQIHDLAAALDYLQAEGVLVTRIEFWVDFPLPGSGFLRLTCQSALRQEVDAQLRVLLGQAGTTLR